MTLTLKLTPAEEARLNAAARREGLSPEQMLHRMLAEHLPAPAPESPLDPTLRLFTEWEAEDAAMTPEEAERERALWDEFERGVNDTRKALGMRTL